MMLSLALCRVSPWLLALCQQANPSPAAPAASASSPAAVPAAVGGSAARSELVLLELLDGNILWGEIAGHDAERLEFVRADTGGRVRLPWKLLGQKQAQKLQEAFGYIDHSGDDLYVDAERLVLTDGTELIGRIVNRTESQIWLKTQAATIPVPILRLQGGATPVRVLALDVFTREELYQEEARRLDKTSAASRFALGEFAERIGAFAYAVANYEACRELDPAFKQAERDARLARSKMRAENQAQVDWLERIDRLRARDKYDEASAELVSFQETHKNSPLRAEAVRLGQRIEREFDKALRRKVPERWHFWAYRMIQDKAREPGLSVDSAIAVLDEQMSAEIVTKVHTELVKSLSANLTPEQIQSLWKERKNQRNHTASYGFGTWLLGEDAALKGLVFEGEASAQAAVSAASNESQEFAEKLKRYLASQDLALQAKNGGGDGVDREAFWSSLSPSSKGQWLLAYYAENSGDMEIVAVNASNCSECGGSGARQLVNANANPAPRQGERSQGGRSQGSGSSGTSVIQCPTCRGLGIIRRVVYR